MSHSDAIRRLRREELLSARKLAALAKVHPLTLVRWITDGKRGHRLDGLRRAGRWHSSLPALERFLAAVEEAAA